MIDAAHLIWIIPLSSLAGGFLWLMVIISSLAKRGVIRKKDTSGAQDADSK